MFERFTDYKYEGDLRVKRLNYKKALTIKGSPCLINYVV